MGFTRAFRHACAVAALAGMTATAAAEVGRRYSEAEKAALMNEWVNCLGKQAEALDDGVTPVDVIGRIIASSCRAEADRAKETMGPFPNERTRQKFLQMTRESEADDAALLVLKIRADRKKQEEAQPSE